MIELAYRRKVTVLGVILGVLVVAYGLGIVFSPSSVQRRESSTPLYPELKAAAVQEIRIEEPRAADAAPKTVPGSSADGAGAAAAIDLQRKGTAWDVLIQGTAFPALTSRIDTFLEQLAGLKKARIASTDPQAWAAFEVDKDKSRRVVLKDGAGKVLVDLYVGKTAPGTQGSYVRREGSNEVVESDRSLSYYASARSEAWSDLKLLPRELQGADLVRVDVRSRISFDADEKESGKGVSHTLLLESTPEGPRWQVQGNSALALAADKVDGLTNNLAAFEGSRFAVNVPDEQAGFGAPSGEVAASTRDNKSYRILVGALFAQEELYYARLEGKPFTWLVPAWRIKQIFKTLDALQAGEKAPGAAAASQAAQPAPEAAKP